MTQVNLFDYSEDQLIGDDAVVTYYEILGLELYATQDAVKKSFRRLSLRYHPDKTQRGEDDYVFRAVKAAYDTLYDPTKRQAYDSTKVPFDDSIPGPNVSEENFYEEYGPVFERNLRYDARLRPELKPKSSGKSRKFHVKASSPPCFGDDETPVDAVNQFYAYWIHFESWRDFSTQAAEELEVEHHLENAESRDERRWLQREIDKRAKQLKKLEMNRIQTLVERAMESDPRLKRQRELERERKKEQLAEKTRALEEQQRIEREQKLLLERMEKEEQEKQAAEKLEREKEKKLIRKARQQLRRMSSSIEESDVTELVDTLCVSLKLDELVQLNETFESQMNGNGNETDVIELIRAKAMEVQQQQQVQHPRSEENKKPFSETNEADGVNRKTTATKQAWTKEELSALAKGVKKYPAGCTNRWDAIASFVNHICTGSTRTKDECVEKYNNIRKNSGGFSTSAANRPTVVPGLSEEESSQVPRPSNEASSTAPPSNVPEGGWTTEQDLQLQEGLTRYPATMDKNERWEKIAMCVDGKTKKECVHRFKAIREALLNKTSK